MIKPKLNLPPNAVIHYDKIRSNAKHLRNVTHKIS